jgi:hypothetical protein
MDVAESIRERRAVRKIGISRSLVLIALAVAGGNALPTAAATAAPLAPLHPGITATAFIITGKISCGTPSSCLAIGENLNKSGNLAQVVEAWNGTAWRSVAVPTPKPTVALINLAAVSCKSPTACVVVGTYTTLAGARTSRPYGLTWNGKSLTPTAAPPVPKDGGFTSLTGVSCIAVRSCVAVGVSQGGAGPLMVETWNGAKWTLQTAGIPGGTRSTYPGAVSCHFVTFCIVAGESYASIRGASAMLLARWNGKSLTVMKAAVPAHAANITLNDISCPSTTMCAVAGFGTNPSATIAFGFAEMWNGKSWTADKMAAPKGDAELYGVSCRADGTCVAVGSAGPSTATTATATAYNGKTWTAQNVPGPGTGKSSDFFGVNCLRAKQCVAFGEILASSPSTATPLGGLWNGSSWRLVPA